MKFSPGFLDEIRSRITISAVVGGKVAWDRRKSNPGKGDFWACCPFHGEKSPSFHVEDRKGRYHCFGCKASGDAFTFLVEKEGLTFPEAVEKLALEAGLQLPKSTQEDRAREEQRKTLYDVVELAAVYFTKKLFEHEGAKALAYLRRRGLRDDTINEFRLGFAPDSKSGLRSHLAEQGISLEQMVEAGLVAAGDDIPAPYDRFRDRVMFPIQDQKGRVIAFGGRAIAEDAPAKYLNSPETELFDKGSVLYNLHRARKPAFDAGKVILVEGYMDVISVYQEGIQNVTAALGTALTENHLRQLWKLAPEPVMCFDGDKAGSAAAGRAMDRALPLFSGGHSLHFTRLSDGKDPADMMREGRRKDFLDSIENAIPAADFFWEREVASAKIDTPEQKAALESKIKLAIGHIADATVRRFYELRMRINLSDLFWKKDKSRLKNPVVRHFMNMPSGREVECAILGMAVEFPKIAIDDVHGFQGWDFSDEMLSIFHRELVRLLVEFEYVTVATIYEKIDPRFFAVLDRVHGDENVEKRQRRGHALFDRMPILKRHPSEQFIAKLFDVLHERLVLDRLQADRDDALRQCELELTPRSEERLLSIIAVIEQSRTHILQLEKEMEEEATMLSSLDRAAA